MSTYLNEILSEHQFQKETEIVGYLEQDLSERKQALRKYKERKWSNGTGAMESLMLAMDHLNAGRIEKAQREARRSDRLLERRMSPDFYADPWELLKEYAARPPGIPLPPEWGLEKEIQMHRGLPVVVGAFSGVGKSRLLCGMALDSINQKRPALFLTLEMLPAQIWANIIQQWQYSTEYHSNDIDQVLAQVRADESMLSGFIEEASRSFSVINCTGYSTSDIISSVEQYRERHGTEPEQIFIDYLQIIRPDGEASQAERRLQVIDSMNKITAAAKETDAVWVIAAQTNRTSHKESAGKPGAPDHSSFQESASIEQNAALTITLKKDESIPTDLHLRISKNRFGRLKEVVLTMDLTTGAVIPSSMDS